MHRQILDINLFGKGARLAIAAAAGCSKNSKVSGFFC